jgi:hypothetical protein
MYRWVSFLSNTVSCPILLLVITILAVIGKGTFNRQQFVAPCFAGLAITDYFAVIDMKMAGER